MVFYPAADVGVATARHDGKFIRGRGADLQEQARFWVFVNQPIFLNDSPGDWQVHYLFFVFWQILLCLKKAKLLQEVQN